MCMCMHMHMYMSWLVMESFVAAAVVVLKPAAGYDLAPRHSAHGLRVSALYFVI